MVGGGGDFLHRFKPGLTSRPLLFSFSNAMKTRLIVLTDLGSFKAYKLAKDPFSSSPQLELVESFEVEATHAPHNETHSDRPGQFAKGSFSSEMANGERHNIDLELRRRGVKEIAAAVSRLLGQPEFDGCYFAAAAEINHQIVDHMTPAARSKIEKNIQSNLAHAGRDKILGHFA
jgi:hypothetical protein